jgi:HD-GYP domain-containing protein (c-di-GMP phosphodiesterase class II)
MKATKLEYSIHTIDDRLLLPSGIELTTRALDELIATNKGTSYARLNLLEYGTVSQDIVDLLRSSPYSVIFNEPNITAALNLMKKVSFIAPILEYLDYFRENDFYTYRHSLVVFAMSTVMARALLERSEDWIEGVMTGTIHDLGKICVPSPVLKKADPLTEADRKILEHHALAGSVLLSYFLQSRQSFAVQVAKEHHERRDGSGYPMGTALKDSMVEIIAACDIYDALLSSRPFRPTPYTNRTALEELTEMAQEGRLSWEVVKSLISHNRKDKPHYRECTVSKEKRGTPPADNVYGLIAKKK